MGLVYGDAAPPYVSPFELLRLHPGNSQQREYRLLKEGNTLDPWRSKVFHNMAPKNPPCTVFVSKPFSMPYAEAMGRLHQWLDRRKLQATSFKITTEGPIGFDVCFSSEREAIELHLFDWEK
jgi:hypothetical protein